jgi:hypothetical protein
LQIMLCVHLSYLVIERLFLYPVNPKESQAFLNQTQHEVTKSGALFCSTIAQARVANVIKRSC